MKTILIKNSTKLNRQFKKLSNIIHIFNNPDYLRQDSNFIYLQDIKTIFSHKGAVKWN